MKLSIITVNLNNRDGLKKTIESVISQTYREFEWIIIDGGSTDGSRELIEEYADYLSYWVSEPDSGIYNGMNKGIRASNGEYLLFLNSGDYLYEDNVLERIIPMLQGKDFYVGKELRDNGWLRDLIVDDTAELCRCILLCYIPHQSTLIHKRIFEIHGMYDETKQLISDWMLFYNALLRSMATIEKIPVIVSVFDTLGRSISKYGVCDAEKYEFLAKWPRLNHITDFYRSNYDIIKALKSSRIGFFLFRIFYFFYRKTRKANKAYQP